MAFVRPRRSAERRLTMELNRMRKDSHLPGITILPPPPEEDEDVFLWLVQINGLEASEWQEAILLLTLRFPDDYPRRPPEVTFLTVPFHPNVDAATGGPRLPMLYDVHNWQGYCEHGAKLVILAIQALLSEPLLDYAVNKVAGDLLMTSPEKYFGIVEHCVAASRYLADMRVRFPTFALSGKPIAAPIAAHAASSRPAAKPKQIDFSDYHDYWRGTATTRPAKYGPNPLVDVLQKDRTLRRLHISKTNQQLKAEAVHKLQRDNELVYGRIPSLTSLVQYTSSQTVLQRGDTVDKLRGITQLFSPSEVKRGMAPLAPRKNGDDVSLPPIPRPYMTDVHPTRSSLQLHRHTGRAGLPTQAPGSRQAPPPPPPASPGGDLRHGRQTRHSSRMSNSSEAEALTKWSQELDEGDLG